MPSLLVDSLRIGVFQIVCQYPTNEFSPTLSKSYGAPVLLLELNLKVFLNVTICQKSFFLAQRSKHSSAASFGVHRSNIIYQNISLATVNPEFHFATGKGDKFCLFDVLFVIFTHCELLQTETMSPHPPTPTAPRHNQGVHVARWHQRLEVAVPEPRSPYCLVTNVISETGIRICKNWRYNAPG